MSKRKRHYATEKKQQPVTRKPAPVKRSSPKIDFYLVAMLIVIVTISVLRMRFVDVPLERDEGEYAYIGKLILDGIAPYTIAYNMKLPGTYSMYALVMAIFGKSPAGIHYGLILVNAGTMLFLFLGFRKLFNASVAFFAASVYGLMAISPNALGFAAHATHFVTFFAALGIFFLAKFEAKKTFLNALLVGLMFGLAFLMKQQAVFFLLFAGIAIILMSWTKPFKLQPVLLPTAFYTAGAILPYLLTILILKIAGAFDKFWFWTVTYASKYAQGSSWELGKSQFSISFDPMWQEYYIFWILFFAGIILIFFSSFKKSRQALALIFGLCAFLTVVPGLYFRQHYFVSFFPGFALLAGISADVITKFLTKTVKINLSFLPFAILLIAAISAMSRSKEFYFPDDPVEFAKRIYGINPFVESIELANYIKENSTKDDKIAVLGSEPQIFFYADRNSATGYIYTYSLMERQQYNKSMQKEMISDIEKTKPKFLVFVGIAFSWLAKKDSPMDIFDWYYKYAQQNYDVVGIADMADAQTIYKWNAEARTYQPKSNQYVVLYKRKQ